MRLPYLQVTQETFQRAKMLAGLLTINRREALGLINDLWAWALDLGPPDTAPTGELISPRAGSLLAGALEWPKERADELLQALEDVGLVECFGQGLRVRGMDRYKRTWEKNHRPKKDQVPETGAKPASTRRATGAKTAPQTQTQTQTQTQKEDLTYVREDPVAAPGAVHLTPEALRELANRRLTGDRDHPHVPRLVEKPSTPPAEWLADDFWRWAQWKRHAAAKLPAEAQPKTEKLSAFWSTARAQYSAELLQEAFLRFGDDPFWQAKIPPLPFGGFMSQWERFVPARSGGKRAS